MIHQKKGSSIIDVFLDVQDERSMRNLISYARQNELTDSEVLSLAVGLSQSGEVINILEGTSLYDIPSTGGPTSLRDRKSVV